MIAVLACMLRLIMDARVKPAHDTEYGVRANHHTLSFP